MKNIFLWICEYWHIIAVCGVIVYLLINESTRKITFKVLCGMFLLTFIVVAVPLVCIWIFGADNGFAIGWLVLFHLLFSVLIYMGAGELCRTIRLHKNGTRTYGTLVRRSLSSRSSSVIEYKIDGKKYECRSLSPLRKYEEGCDKVPVIYDSENPELSCIEKYEFAPIIALLSTYAVLEIGMIALTVYMCRLMFS